MRQQANTLQTHAYNYIFVLIPRHIVCNTNTVPADALHVESYIHETQKMSHLIIDSRRHLTKWSSTLQWRPNDRDGVSNHRRLDYLDNRSFRRRTKKTLKLCFTGLCEGNSPVTVELPAQRSNNAENVSIWWRHHEMNVNNNMATHLVLTVTLVEAISWN